jgi:hypothetical protein
MRTVMNKYRIKVKTGEATYYFPQKRFFFIFWFNLDRAPNWDIGPNGSTTSIFYAKKCIEEDKTRNKFVTTYRYM